MPTLVTRGKGKKKLKYWKGVVMVKGDRREQLFRGETLAVKREAIAWENETRERLKRGAIPSDTDSSSSADSQVEPVSLLEWGNTYLDHCENKLSPRTIEEKNLVFKRFIEFFGAEFPVQKLGHPQALKYLTKQFKDRSGYSANRDRKNLSAAWNWGSKYLADFPKSYNIFQDAERFPEVREPRYIPPEQDFWKVCNACQAQDRIMLVAFLHLGARKGEIFRMKWDDVDFENMTVRLWTKKREGGNYEFSIIPMTEILATTLKLWKEDTKIDSEYVFTNQDSTHLSQKHYGKKFTSRQHFMERACNRVSVKHFTFHAIRHLTATVLYNEGVQVAVIQRILRHKSATTTTRYLHELGLDDTRDALGSVMDRKRAKPSK